MIKATCIALFELPAIGSDRAGQAPWPLELRKKYEAFEAQGGFAIIRGSETYESFLRDAAALGVNYRENWHAKADPRQSPAYQVFYLDFALDKEYERALPPVWETFVSECNERGTRCAPREVREPLVVDVAKTRKLDLLELPSWSRPRIFLVSARAREVIEAIDASGVAFRRCQYKSGKQPVTLSNEPFFEMSIADLERPLEGDPEIIPAEHRCNVCGTVEHFVPRNGVVSWLGDQQATLPDFFCVKSARTPHEHFELGSWQYFVSARVLAGLLDHELKGLRATAPSIGIKFVALFRDSMGLVDQE